MSQKWYVCPVHRQIVLFRKSRFESLVKIETVPAFCPECSKYYLKHECVEIEQGEEEIGIEKGEEKNEQTSN